VSVLILNRGPLDLRPYDRWLAGHPELGELLLLASAEALGTPEGRLPDGLSGYAYAEAIVGYDTTGLVEARALELARRFRITHVVACQETDLVRAAVIREILGIAGQDVDSATAFRDKVVMKQRATAAGITVARYAEVETATDVLAFAREHGYPLVFKPRDGQSSIGLAIIRDLEALAEFLAGRDDLGTGSVPALMVEAYVSGRMCHVDGLVVDGEVVAAWPSQYQYQLAALTDEGPRLDLTLDPADPLAVRLLDLTDRVLAALPTPRHTTFHMEVFHTDDDRLVLCEIASRNGGALIKSVLEAMYGLNFPVEWVRTQLGLPLPIAVDGRLRPARMAGQMLLLKRPGQVRHVPERPPFEWIEAYSPYIADGDTMNRATSSGDFMVAMVASGDSRDEVEARLRMAGQWFMDNVIIEHIRETVG
jgi:hypothetical protein